MGENKYVSHKNLKIWSIYWFKRSWLSEKKFKNKGDYRPCVVLAKRENQLVLIPFSTSKTNPKWNIEYNSATRNKPSNIQIDRFRILDPKSIVIESKNCSPVDNVKFKNQNAKISSKKIKKEIINKYNERLSYLNLK